MPVSCRVIETKKLRRIMAIMSTFSQKPNQIAKAWARSWIRLCRDSETENQNRITRDQNDEFRDSVGGILRSVGQAGRLRPTRRALAQMPELGKPKAGDRVLPPRSLYGRCIHFSIFSAYGFCHKLKQS